MASPSLSWVMNEIGGGMYGRICFKHTVVVEYKREILSRQNGFHFPLCFPQVKKARC